MFILNSESIPVELYNKLNIKEEDLDTLVMCDEGEAVPNLYTFGGRSYIVTNTWDELNTMTRDTGIGLLTTNSSFYPYEILSFVSEG
jgi:hypothetical protein